jgi:exonuclease SbcC
LPDDQSEAKIEEQRQKFEADKKRKMEANVAQGKKLKEQDAALIKSIEEYEVNLNVLFDEITNLGVNANELREKLTQLPENIDIESHPEYQAIQQQITTLEAEMDKPVEDVTHELLAQKQSIMTEIERLNAILNDRDVQAKTQERIKELEAEERKLAQQISEFEGHKFLIEKFVKTKVSMLEESINSKFQAVTFKLFDVQINGGVNECCEAMINGVPYADANRAAQINAGIDIINTITRHYGITAPVFVDNAEAVNELIPCDSQVIRLLVSNDKTLKVEINKAKEGVLFE